MNRTLLSFLLIVGLLLAGCGSDSGKKGNVLASFDGGMLTSEDLAVHYQKLKKQSKYRNHPELLTPEFAFEHALNMEMIIAKGLQKKLHQDPRLRQEIHGHMSELFLRVMEEELIPRIERESITDEEALAYYEEHKDNYLVNAYYDLLAFEIDPDQGGEVMDKLTRGEMTFAEATATYAVNNKERQNGGVTGRRTLRLFQPAWRPVVEGLAVGKLTGPVEIDAKTYVLLLNDKTEPRQHSFEEKKEYVRNDVLYQRYRDQWQQTYNRLRGEFKVKVNGERLGRFCEELQKEMD